MFKTLAALALACSALLARADAEPAAGGRFQFDTTPGNLPKSVVPLRYVLRLDLDPARDDFGGEAQIDVEVREPVGAIVLHARDLEAGALELRQGGSTRTLDLTPGPFEQSWWLEPRDAQVIAPGRYELRLTWRGRVNSTGSGLYRAESRTLNAAGSTEVQPMLATQLEAIDARTVFPGFDEPAFRAVFELTVRAPAGYTVLSNMPELKVDTEGAFRLHRFAPTPPMPSYLVALAVGRFDVAEGRAAGVPLRVITSPGKAAQAALALRATSELLPFYTAYFGQPYALPKLDQLAVPSTRDGAMEDWGLLSYRENSLLFDPQRSSPQTERSIFGTVAHELAHQWFGNLVSAASWEELWLNEAFATWMASKATRQFRPEWHSELAQRRSLDRTLAGDVGSATRAVRSGPVGEGSVNDIFDGITYVKGAAVLGMLEQWLGEDTFREGISAYLQERRLSSATADDLWFHLGRAARRDVAGVATSWIDQTGYPLLQVGQRCVDGRTQLVVAQRRFGASPDEQARLWRIPLRVAHGGKVLTLPLDAAADGFELPGCFAAPTLVNAGGAGYYRVKYEAQTLAAFQRRFASLAPQDQVAMLSDSHALAREGAQPYTPWLGLLAALPEVRGAARAPLFEQALAAFGELDAALAGTAAQAPLRAAARRLLGAELARLGWVARAGESPQARALRPQLIEQLARFDDAATLAEARRRFDAEAAGGAPLPPAIRAAVWKAVGVQADGPRFATLLARLKASTAEEERLDLALALSAGRDAGRAAALLNLALDPALPSNVALALPGLVATRSPFGAQAYAFTLAQWPALSRRAGSADGLRTGLLPAAAGGFNTAADAQRLLADQRERVGADGALPAAREAAHIERRARTRERDAAALAALLAPRTPTRR